MNGIEERYTPNELLEYEDSLKTYRDLKNSLDTAEEKGVVKGIAIGREEGMKVGREEGIKVGRAEGRAEGMKVGKEEGRTEEKIAIAQKMKASGMPAAVISEITGLTAEDIESV